MPNIKEFYMNPLDGSMEYQYDDDTIKVVKPDQLSSSGGGFWSRK